MLVIPGTREKVIRAHRGSAEGTRGGPFDFNAWADFWAKHLTNVFGDKLKAVGVADDVIMSMAPELARTVAVTCAEELFCFFMEASAPKARAFGVLIGKAPVEEMNVMLSDEQFETDLLSLLRLSAAA